MTDVITRLVTPSFFNVNFCVYNFMIIITAGNAVTHVTNSEAYGWGAWWRQRHLGNTTSNVWTTVVDTGNNVSKLHHYVTWIKITFSSETTSGFRHDMHHCSTGDKWLIMGLSIFIYTAALKFCLRLVSPWNSWMKFVDDTSYPR